MTTYTETAYAKINLALHVCRRRDDGYHDIETLFAFLDAGDTLTATATANVTFSISGPFGDDLLNAEDNLVLRTARLMQDHFQTGGGAQLTLQKNLPVASGIGGGSADAAAAARLLCKVWKLDATDADLANLLAPLGSDIPACVSSTTVFGNGTGTTLVSIDGSDLSGLPALLVNPRKPVYTGAVFAAWDGVDRGALGAKSPLTEALRGRNDLEAPAIDICPEVGDVLDALRKTGPIFSRMSGSGATCFALYESVETRHIAQSSMNPSWWSLAGQLR